MLEDREPVQRLKRFYCALKVTNEWDVFTSKGRARPPGGSSQRNRHTKGLGVKPFATLLELLQRDH